MHAAATDSDSSDSDYSHDPDDTDDSFAIPHNAVVSGQDLDGSTIYAGSAYHANHWIPAKIIPARRVAYVPYNGMEHESHQHRVRN